MKQLKHIEGHTFVLFSGTPLMVIAVSTMSLVNSAPAWHIPSSLLFQLKIKKHRIKINERAIMIRNNLSAININADLLLLLGHRLCFLLLSEIWVPAFNMAIYQEHVCRSLKY